MLIFLMIIMGLTAGFIDTIAGGGGIITLPAYLLAGLPPHTAIGTNKLSGTLSVGNAARIFLKKKIFHAKYWHAAIIATFSGGLFGAITIQFLSAAFLRQLVPFILIFLVLYIAIPKRYSHHSQEHYRSKKLSSGLMGSLLGFYDGFIGPGTGSFWVVALMAIYKIPMVEATAVAKLMNFLSSSAALLIFIIFGDIHYELGLIVAAAMMVGAFLGAHSTIRWGVEFVRPLFILVMSGMAAALAYQTSWQSH